MSASAPSSPSNGSASDNPLVGFGTWIARHLVLRLLLINIMVWITLVVGGILAHWLFVESERIDAYLDRVATSELDYGRFYATPWGVDPARLGQALADRVAPPRERPPTPLLLHRPEGKNRVAWLRDELLGRYMASLRAVMAYQTSRTTHLLIAIGVPRSILLLEWLAIGALPILAAWHLGSAASRREQEAGYYPSTPQSAAYLKVILWLPALLTASISLPFAVDFALIDAALIAAGVHCTYHFRRVFIEIFG